MNHKRKNDYYPSLVNDVYIVTKSRLSSINLYHSLTKD